MHELKNQLCIDDLGFEDITQRFLNIKGNHIEYFYDIAKSEFFIMTSECKYMGEHTS